MVNAGAVTYASDANYQADVTLAKPILRMVQTVVQSMPDNVLTALTFTTEEYDTDDMHDPAINNTRVTVKRPGYYLFAGSYYSSAMTTPASRSCYFRKNGVTAIPPGPRDAGASITSSAECWCRIPMNAGDYVELMGIQDSSGAVNTSVTAQQSSVLEAEFIRPF